MTSRQVVDHVQTLVRPAKAGHAGTLDPLASGVLVVCVGAATRLIEYVQRLPKRYRAAFLLGRRSDTDDVEGRVEELVSPPQPGRPEIESACAAFVGVIQQRPPDFSAVKIQGRRAYDLARRGKPVSLAPRPVRIDRLEVLAYEYPELRLEVECGSGTYIRSLGRDLAASLGTCAVMAELTRTAIGEFRLETACGLPQLDATSLAQWLLPATSVFPQTKPELLSDEEVLRVFQGQRMMRSSHGRSGAVPAVDGRGRLVAVLIPKGCDWLGPVCTFPHSAGVAADQKQRGS